MRRICSCGKEMDLIGASYFKDKPVKYYYHCPWCEAVEYVKFCRSVNN